MSTREPGRLSERIKDLSFNEDEESSVSQSGIMFSSRNRENSIKGDGISIVFDLIISESHSWNLTVPAHKVEEGSPFTDHIRKELRRGSMVGLISTFGLKRDEPTDNYVQTTFDIFEEYYNKAIPVTIVTTLKVYEDYIITSLPVSRSGDSGESQEFAISFQEFKTVSLQETGGVSLIKIPVENLGTGGPGSGPGDDTQASPNKDVGEQTGKENADRWKVQRYTNYTDFMKNMYAP